MKGKVAQKQKTTTSSPIAIKIEAINKTGAKITLIKTLIIAKRILLQAQSTCKYANSLYISFIIVTTPIKLIDIRKIFIFS